MTATRRAPAPSAMPSSSVCAAACCTFSFFVCLPVLSAWSSRKTTERRELRVDAERVD